MTIGGKHTFRDWSLVPTEIPSFAPAMPDMRYQDVPGALPRIFILYGNSRRRFVCGCGGFLEVGHGVRE